MNGIETAIMEEHIAQICLSLFTTISTRISQARLVFEGQQLGALDRRIL
jgi:hypothetical protein